MKIGESEVANLIATFAPTARQRMQELSQNFESELPREPTDQEWTRIQLQVFFVQLFDEVCEERVRLAAARARSSAAQSIPLDQLFPSEKAH